LLHVGLGLVCYLTPTHVPPAPHVRPAEAPPLAIAFIAPDQPSPAEPTPSRKVEPPTYGMEREAAEPSEPPPLEMPLVDHWQEPAPPDAPPPPTPKPPPPPEPPSEEPVLADLHFAPEELPEPQEPEPPEAEATPPEPEKEPVAQEPQVVEEPVQETSSTAPSTVASPAEYSENPPPPYPRIARRRGYEGLVVLDVRVSAAGTALAVEVKQSSGHVVLDAAAAAAVREWRFRPAVLNGAPIESNVDVPVRFKLID
jgi:protein TonB